MKNNLLFLATLATISLVSCKKDPPPLDLDRFDVIWYDDDGSGTKNIKDALGFDFQVETTDPDAEDQFITEWEFSYSVNGHFAGILQGDEGTHTNTLNFKGDVYLDNLPYPGPGQLEEGDAIEFRMWCIDNYGTQLEQIHRFVLEE